MEKSQAKWKTILKNYKFSIILLMGVVVGALLGVFLGEKAGVLPYRTGSICLNRKFYCKHGESEKAGKSPGSFLCSGSGRGNHHFSPWHYRGSDL